MNTLDSGGCLPGPEPLTYTRVAHTVTGERKGRGGNRLLGPSPYIYRVHYTLQVRVADHAAGSECGKLLPLGDI